MRKRLLLSCLLLVISRAALYAQLPLIRATTQDANIRDGNNFYKAHWHISPGIRPDTYIPDLGREHRVTFYTDLDSISFLVAPGNDYDFIILLNGKDTAYTRISTNNPVQLSYEAAERKRDGGFELPFTLGKGDKIHIHGSINGSKPLDLMFDTGSDQVVISKRGLQKGVQLRFDDSSQSVGFGGTINRQRSSRNQIVLSGLRWDGVPIVAMDNADADGIVGYNLFKGRIVQLDFDANVLRVYDSLPPVPAGYTKLDLQFRSGLPFIEALMTVKDSGYGDLFEFDSGSSGSLFVNKASAQQHRLYGTMPLLEDNRKSRGVDGNPVYSQRVLLPKLNIGGNVLTNVPIDIEQLSGSNAALHWPIFGMDIIRRFNIILDYSHCDVYLKPNSLYHTLYHTSSDTFLPIAIVSGLTVLIAGIVAYLYKRKKQHAHRV